MMNVVFSPIGLAMIGLAMLTALVLSAPDERDGAPGGPVVATHAVQR